MNALFYRLIGSIFSTLLLMQMSALQLHAADLPTTDFNINLKDRILGAWVYKKEASALTTTEKLIFKEDGVFEHQLILEYKAPILKSSDRTVVSPGKWDITEGEVHFKYKILFGDYEESDPPIEAKVIFKDAKSFVMTDKHGKERDDVYTHQQSVRNVDSGPSGGTEAVKELTSEKDLPELTADQFSSRKMIVGMMKQNLEKDNLYQIAGSIMQVGSDFIQIDDGNSESHEAEPYALVKVTPEFLEEFPGMKGDKVRFLAEFAGYGNFPNALGINLRLAIFKASYHSSWYGGQIKVIDKDLAKRAIAMLPPPAATNQKSGGTEAVKELKPEKALPELTYDQFNSCEMIVGLKGQNLEKDKLYQVAGNITRLGSDFIKIVDENSDWDEAEPYASVKVTREFLENFPGEGGDKVRFLAEFTGYSDSPNASGNNIRLANFKASYYSSWDGGQIEVIDKDLAKRAIAILQPPTATNQKKAEESKDKSKTAGVGEPMQTGPSKSAEADSTEADSVKIKIAELKGELAVIDSKIDLERKRWKEASDLINVITNNGTQPVIRNSPEHVRMYESQVIMKDVEAKAPELKEQKVRLEAALKALE